MPLLSTDDIKEVVIKAIGTNCTVTNYSLETFSSNKDGLLGSHFLLKVTVKNEHSNDGDCEVKMHTFFVKSLPESALILDLMDESTFEEEVNFYNYIKPLMLEDYVSEKWSPTCYLAENNVLVLEDLRVAGFAMNLESTMSEQFLKSALATLARFHASTLLAEAKLGKPLNKVFPKSFSEKMFNENTKFGQGTILGFKTIVLMLEKLNLDSSLVLPYMYNYVHKNVRPQKTELNVVCHSDLWKNNIMFNEKMFPDCVIVDYQILRYTTPVADLSMLLYLNTSPEFRNNFEMQLVNHYYYVFQETLRQSKVNIKIPTAESMLNAYKKYRIIGMVMAAIYLPAMYMEPDDLKKLLNDPQALERYMLLNRIEIISPYLDSNVTYRKKMKDLLSELVNEGKLVLNC